ncbi:MAG: flavin reductase family protein [Planctomycetota bacterium]
MQLDFDSLGKKQIYDWMSGLITPRPIAWVSTLSIDGVANLAPFSYFNAVGTEPPTLMFCPANRADGSEKDTLQNVRRSGEFVLNLVSPETANAMNETAAEVDPSVDEFQLAGLDPAPSRRIAVPRVQQAHVAFECKLHTTLTLGTGPGGAAMVIGRIVSLNVADSILNPDGTLNHDAHVAIGRMAGSRYISTEGGFELERPK